MSLLRGLHAPTQLAQVLRHGRVALRRLHRVELKILRATRGPAPSGRSGAAVRARHARTLTLSTRDCSAVSLRLASWNISSCRLRSSVTYLVSRVSSSASCARNRGVQARGAGRRALVNMPRTELLSLFWLLRFTNSARKSLASAWATDAHGAAARGATGSAPKTWPARQMRRRAAHLDGGQRFAVLLDGPLRGLIVRFAVVLCGAARPGGVSTPRQCAELPACRCCRLRRAARADAPSNAYFRCRSASSCSGEFPLLRLRRCAMPQHRRRGGGGAATRHAALPGAKPAGGREHASDCGPAGALLAVRFRFVRRARCHPGRPATSAQRSCGGGGTRARPRIESYHVRKLNSRSSSLSRARSSARRGSCSVCHDAAEHERRLPTAALRARRCAPATARATHVAGWARGHRHASFCFTGAWALCCRGEPPPAHPSWWCKQACPKAHATTAALTQPVLAARTSSCRARRRVPSSPQRPTMARRERCCCRSRSPSPPRARRCCSCAARTPPRSTTSTPPRP